MRRTRGLTGRLRLWTGTACGFGLATGFRPALPFPAAVFAGALLAGVLLVGAGLAGGTLGGGAVL